ncbi:RTA1 multi-domain protein [Pyrenophora tritici-repentis]|nr:RTA1 multi-domain protein [Pyrenophora tritici-repentis]
MGIIRVEILGEVIGYIGRVMLNLNPSSMNSSLQPHTFTIVLLTAGIYLSLGRVIVAIGAEISRLTHKMYTYIFVGCDILALILQAIGGDVATTPKDHRGSRSGVNIMIADFRSAAIFDGTSCVYSPDSNNCAFHLSIIFSRRVPIYIHLSFIKGPPITDTMERDRRLTKALEAAGDALQHLSMSPDFGCLDYTHIDRLLARVVDLPTEGSQRNSRRNLLVIRQWMVTEGPAVILLEVLGQTYWRLSELNSTQFEKFKTSLQQQQPYTSLVQNHNAIMLVIQRIRHIQRSKADACDDFLCELTNGIGTKVDSPMVGLDTFGASPCSPARSICSQDSSPSQETCFTGLIKYLPSSPTTAGGLEQILIDFYVKGICPGRTVSTQSNAYTSLLQVADTCPSTRHALLSLSASYIGEHFPGEKDTYHQAELYYSTQALKALAAQISEGQNYEGALATSMILMHHGMINQEDSPLCWSCHANIFNTIPPEAVDHHSSPALFMRAQLILARTAQSSRQLQNTRQHLFETTNWLETTTLTEASKISGTLGVSPQLVSLISSITLPPTNPPVPDKLAYAQLQEIQLHNLKQWTVEPDSTGKDVLLATAECFRLAALIYLRCRIYGYTRTHPSVTSLSAALHSLVLSLPVKGPFYTAIYPVWPLFIAAVTTDADRREVLYQRVVPIREGDKNTLPAVLKWVSELRVWLARLDGVGCRQEGWWDEMVSLRVGKMGRGGGLLCLG